MQQWKAVKKVIFEKQEAHHLENEPLKVSNVLEHYIILNNIDKIVFMKPR